MSGKFSRAERSWILVDAGNSAFATTILTAVFPIYLTALVPKDGVTLNLGFISWNTSGLALWGYTVSFSALVTLFISVFLSAWADARAKRKLIFIFFTILGALGTLLLGIFRDWPSLYFSFLIANVGFAGSFVFYNSLLNFVAHDGDRDRVSLHGFAWGYISGGLMLFLNLLLIMKFEWFGLESKAAGSRLSFILCGFWWLAMSVPAMFCIHEDKNVELLEKSRLMLLWETIKTLPKQKALLLFILSYFFCNEGIQTVVAMSSPYGQEVLGLKQEHLIGTFLIIQFIGWPATLFMVSLTRWFGALKVYAFSILAWLAIVAYAYFMNSIYHFLALGIFVAMILGVSQALPRSIYSRLIPKGKEAEYFTLFALSGRSTPVIGPFLFAAVADGLGDPRIAIVSLATLFLIGFVSLKFVAAERLVRAS